MEQLLRTVFYDKHVGLGAKMVEFGIWGDSLLAVPVPLIFYSTD